MHLLWTIAVIIGKKWTGATSGLASLRVYRQKLNGGPISSLFLLERSYALVGRSADVSTGYFRTSSQPGVRRPGRQSISCLLLTTRTDCSTAHALRGAR